MYKAPIEICRTIEDIIQKVVEETDNQVYEAVCRVGVNVDKEELIKALRYDRGQYEKGYADGVRDFAERLKQFVEVIRCGKCRFGNTDGFCFKNINGVGYKKVSADDYCSYGKTKESE